MPLTINIEQIKTLLEEHNLLKSLTIEGNSFTSVTYDSRTVTTNSLFFCKGNFKPKYLVDAKQHGATGYVSEKPYVQGSGLTQIIVTDIQKAMALIGACFYQYPQNKLFLIAYTGTKGKTTSAYFTRSILQHTTHNKVGMQTTIDTFLGNGAKYKSSLTTPESLDTFRNMYQAVRNGMRTYIMEVSSQSYLKNRVYGLHYDVGFFLNITPDHIGINEHPNFANYLHCKEQLLRNSKICVINAETQHLAKIYATAKATTKPQNIYLFSRKDAYTEIPVPIDFEFQSLKDTMHTNEILINPVSNKAKYFHIHGKYKLAMPGDFNESNATASAIASVFNHATSQDIYKGLSTVTVPGRMERYLTKSHGTIYVDYAHDYGSMHALLSFLRRENHQGHIICVLGSTGDKGQNRRVGFGMALSENANQAILTTDDPGYESPLKIAQEIKEHITNKHVKVQIILRRSLAIQQAVKDSKSNDMVVIAGKGRDPYQKIKGQNMPYPTDSVIVKDTINQYNL